ncbi:MAG: YlxR family protein [Actinomycetota bacterium]|nr:YlxR family protein [Actinomycetota bacterium]MDP2288416.1 YlxR family protein [Actinomycetota bacterium]
MSPDVLGPVRTCVGCRKRAPQGQLIRVAQEGGALRIGREAAGRGAWLHPTLQCFGLAERRSAFGRALGIAGPLDSTALACHLEGQGPQASAL